MKLLENEIGPARELIFLDLEGAQLSHEAIAIGACAYICDEHLMPVPGKKVKHYKRYIRADGRVGKVVTVLTGITDRKLEEDGISFERAVSELVEATKVPGAKRKYITFGNQDLAMLHTSAMHDPTGKALSYYSHIRKNWFDLQEFISRFVFDSRHITYSQQKLLQIFEAQNLEHPHDPLYDAENLMNLFLAVSHRPDILAQWFLKNMENIRLTGRILKPILSRLSAGEDVTGAEFRQYVEDYFA